MEKVKFEQDGYIAYVTLNRPENLNSLDYETLVQLGEVVDEIKTSKNIRTVIFTGAGDKAFCAGADLKERKHLNEQQVRRNVNKIRDVFTKIEELPQPTIAAINGYALGGGFELALACDFRYAVEKALLGLTEVSWAIVPGAGGTQRLPRLIGPSKAKELILTARKISANEAYELGILNKVTKDRDELEDAVLKLSDEISKNGPVAVTQAKFAIQYGLNTDIQTGLAIESKAYEMIIDTKDRVEALKAFEEKRQPNFIGE